MLKWERKRTWSARLTDVAILAAGLALLYGLVRMSGMWLGPYHPAVEISLRPSALPAYAAYSLFRMAIAYLLSLLFAVAYGWLASRSSRAEQLMIPLLDVLQSIPVLSFLPAVMLAMVGLFPHHEVGVELGVILLIFTGQTWNIAFSFYSSVKSIPRELGEVAGLYRFSAWQRFLQLELPYAAIGLVWNSMMSVAGGWFFLMACEMFVLGQRDFRVPGLGSYLQTAASAGDTRAILWGLATMVGVIILLDQLIWRPLTAWSGKFRFEQLESTTDSRSFWLDFVRQSRTLRKVRKATFDPLMERVALFFARRARAGAGHGVPTAWKMWVTRAAAAVAVAAIGLGAVRAVGMMTGLNGPEIKELLRGAGWTFVRVTAALLLGALWTIPAGVAIGLHPRLARIAQPLAQIAASVPATALFPVVLLVLIRAGGGMQLASILLILLGTQWYLLFNVIAGASSIPTDLKEAASVFKFGALERWRNLILPGIFPYLITGFVTASGGAWNASIVAEYFQFKGKILSTEGLGATINKATDSGNFDLLLAATLVMALIVVTVNRLLWRRLYRLAERRFRIEA